MNWGEDLSQLQLGSGGLEGRVRGDPSWPMVAKCWTLFCLPALTPVHRSCCQEGSPWEPLPPKE